MTFSMVNEAVSSLLSSRNSLMTVRELILTVNLFVNGSSYSKKPDNNKKYEE